MKKVFFWNLKTILAKNALSIIVNFVGMLNSVDNAMTVISTIQKITLVRNALQIA